MQIRNAIALACLVLSPLSMAACPPSLGVAQQVVCLQQENAVLQQRLANAQVEQSLEKITSASSPTRDLGWPSVSMIYGSPGHEHAVLVWLDGSGQTQGTLSVIAGDALPGGMKVESVSSNRVVLRKGKTEHVLLMNSPWAGGGAHAQQQPTTTSLTGGGPATQIPAFPFAPTQGERP